MASSLICEFVTNAGSTRSITFGNIDPSVNRTSVRQLCTGIVSNSAALLKETFVSAKTATLRTTTDTPFDLSE